MFEVNRNVQTLHAFDYVGKTFTFTKGNKFFELTNHLGNVLATISDRKLMTAPDNDGCEPTAGRDVLDVNERYNEVNYIARLEVNFNTGFESPTDDAFEAYLNPSLSECPGVSSTNQPVGFYFRADVITANDYHPKGIVIQSPLMLYRRLSQRTKYS